MMSTFTMIENEVEPFIGPPKPMSCVDGWLSHGWMLVIEEGRISLTTKECRLCDDGISDVESEYFSGDIPVKLDFHKEYSYGGEVDVWWEIVPAPVCVVSARDVMT